jgi:alkylation response protein AidB-like acyl-CoA dehydrogenase
MVRLAGVVVPADHVLPGAGDPFGLQIQSALAYGRLSIAWGCLGIIRACLSAAASHAALREQFGAPIAKHQLVAGRLGDMYAAEQIVARLCEYAAACWRDSSPDLVTAVFTAKHVGAIQANAVASSAVQVLASAGAHDGGCVARAYRDAKLMEIIEGSTEMGRLHLAERALAVWA